MEANHNFEMLKQSLEDSVAAEEKELDEAKKEKAVGWRKDFFQMRDGGYSISRFPIIYMN